MDLKAYLQTTTQDDLAERLGVTQGMVSHWVAGRSRVTAERAVDIEAATDGAVTRYELRPDIFGPAPQGVAA